jgi:biopolymer transport protein TolR
METRGHDRPTGQSLNSEINVTPLVDVMLVVLIIFIVVTPMLQRGVGVDLPRARNVEVVSDDQNRILTLVLQGNGQMLLGSAPITQADLPGALRERHQADPSLQLQIKADRTVHYGEIKQLLQAGRTAGFHGATLIAREVEPARTAATLAELHPAGQGD